MNPNPQSGPELDAIIFDIGDTLVEAARPGTPVNELEVNLRPRVIEDLLQLKQQGFRLAAVTDTAVMTEADVRDLLRPSGLETLLEVVVTSVDVGAAKPNPRSLKAALDRLGIAPRGALYIGDRVIDQQAAVSAGTHFAFIGTTVEATFRQWRHDPTGAFAAAVQRWQPAELDRQKAFDEALAQLDQRAKPPGSLGRLETLAATLSGLAGTCPPPIPTPAAVAVFAADHGVHDAGVSAWPQDVTVAMVETMVVGRAAVNALATTVGATVSVFDVGVARPVSGLPAEAQRRIRAGTRNLAAEPAMTLAEAVAALNVGAEVADQLIARGAGCLVAGEMGIANTTAAAALIAAFTNKTGAEVAGRGAGADDATLARKVAAIDAGLARHRSGDHPLEVLASLGGLEIAALVGLMVGAVSGSIPVVVDGAIANAALLAADQLVPGVARWVIPGHRSAEPAASMALDAMGLEPLLDLGMRLGEGTGAVLAVPLLEASVRALVEIAAIDEVTASRGGPGP